MERSELTFFDIYRLYLRKKWWFIVVFIIVLIASFSYFYLKPVEYSVNSKIKISESYIGSNNELYNYFPEETEKLWIFATHRQAALEDENLSVISYELKSVEVLEDIYDKLRADSGTVINNLNDSIIINIDSTSKDLVITTNASDPNVAYDINKTLLEVYLDKKKLEFEQVYDSFLTKIGERVEDDYQKIQDLTYEKKNNDVEYDTERSKPVEQRNLDYMAEKLTNSTLLDKSINELYKEYNTLKIVQNNFIENKDFFINRITVLEEPQTSNISSSKISLKKSIAYSFLLAVVAAFIVTSIVSLASYSKYIRRH